jgi:hypothetical protein
MSSEYEWVHTPGWRSDAEIAGKPLHAVSKNSRSACGLYRRQWVVDLFADSITDEDKCKRCLKALARAEQGA